MQLAEARTVVTTLVSATKTLLYSIACYGNTTGQRAAPGGFPVQSWRQLAKTVLCQTADAVARPRLWAGACAASSAHAAGLGP